MLRSPLGVAQAALARPSHCGHTLWAHIEGITHNAEVVGNKIFKKIVIKSLIVISTTSLLYLYFDLYITAICFIDF